MKSTLMTAIDEVIALKLQAIDDYIKTVIVPLENVGNPEKLIGKPYQQWTPQDTQILSGIYGAALEKFIAKKEIDYLYALEKGVV